MHIELNTDQVDPFHILTSTRMVLKDAELVSINTNALPALGKVLEEIMPAMKTRYIGTNKEQDVASAAQKAFILNTLNFCFWAEQNAPIWTIEWPKGKIHRGGVYALMAALDRAEADGYPIYNATYLSHLSLRDARSIWRSETSASIPLLHERVKNLREAGRVLSRLANGNFLNVIESINHDAIDLTRALIKNFPSFNDTTQFNGKRVYFYKRAQICAHSIALLSSLFPKLALHNTEQLTAFADYRLPQVYRHFDILHLHKKLADTVDTYQLILQDSREEIEIRSATIWVAELLRQYFGGTYTVRDIDFASWLLSQKIKNDMLPHIRVYTICY